MPSPLDKPVSSKFWQYGLTWSHSVPLQCAPAATDIRGAGLKAHGQNLTGSNTTLIETELMSDKE